jgi:uncharacterized protein (TIGR03086 family)
MRETDLMACAGVPLAGLIDHIKPDQLDAPTPCTEFDVRRLINHLLFWAPSLEAAAYKRAVPTPAESESGVDLVEDDWASTLQGHVDRAVAAWSDPAAWHGVTQMGGPTELPAPLVGGMVVGELVVHGWDLGRATGQQPGWDDDLLEYLYGEVDRSAELGRQMGIYGPEVHVSPSAPILDRVLALSGRDPAWTP